MKRILLCCIPVLAAAALPVITAEVPATDAPAAAAAPRPEADPKVVATQVEQALKNAPGVPATGITVTTHASVIVLNGKVASEAEKARAESVAQAAAGEVRTSSQIEVMQPVDGPSQQAAVSLVKNVEDALKRDMATANLGVTVSIDDQQTIGLYGLVPSREARSAVERVAARVQGVRKIDSRLVIPGG
jgi:osmotically-inducible protein OsmY